MDGYANQVEFAAIVGVSQPRIAKLVAQGKLGDAVIREGHRTWINIQKGQQNLKKNLDPINQQNRVKKPALQPEKTEKIEKKKAVAETGGTRAMDYNTARTINEQYKAALKKLEYQRLSGSLIPAEEVRNDAFLTGRRVRDALLGIPDRISASLAAKSDVDEIKKMLNEELRAAIGNIAGE
jgi:hypothetical protein